MGTVLVYATAHISGAHINPAVTFSAIAYKKIGIRKGIIYIIAQCVGGILGGLVLKNILPAEADPENPVYASLGANFVAERLSATQAFFVEFIFTMFLVFVVFGVAIDPAADRPRGRSGFFAPLAIGLAVFIAHLFCIPLTGCGINPARSLGSAVASGQWKYHYIFWLGPMAGGLFGASLYSVPFIFLMRKKDREQSQKEEEKKALLPRTQVQSELEGSVFDENIIDLEDPVAQRAQ
eukprot:Colp12_sorted_trinity150504_noHs@7626